MYFVGVDIGSTAAKTVVRGDQNLEFVLPTGWSSVQTAAEIRKYLLEHNIDVDSNEVKVVATGYGRISVDFADKQLTEISCHARGARELGGDNCTVIDVGGQDTKVICVRNGSVSDFLMNDKCSAGTGKFIEIMANRLGVDIEVLFELADQGKVLPISSMCTVFAESEIISYIGEGRERADIAAGIVDSVVGKVAVLCGKIDLTDPVILTGGLAGNQSFAKALSKRLGHEVQTRSSGRYAGALGAALLAAEKLQ